MTDQERLDALVVRYEELRAEHTPVSAAELCHDCPELRAALERQIADLESLNALLDLEESAAPSGVTPELGADPPAFAPAPPAADLATGCRFHLLRLHAKGGLGEVHLARDEGLQREVALKRLQPVHAQQPESRRRFLREAEITSHLEHPSIVPVYAVGEDAQGQPFYAMRFVQGQTLLEALEAFHAAAPRGRETQGRRLALRQLLSRFVAVCNTVAYAHSRGILHRDIKPGNILLGQYGETLLLDWGLARRFAGADGEPTGSAPFLPAAPRGEADTQPGDVLGTPAYMSPEQAEGRANVLGPASDVYSLGATLYALLTGMPPFQERHLGALLEKVRRGEFPPPRQRKPDVPRALEAVCQKAMARQPDQRYAGALELAADLEHWLADEPVRAWREPWPVRAGRWLRRHRLKVAAAVAALGMAVVCLGVAAWFLLAAYRDTERQRDLARTQRDKAQTRLRLARTAVDQLTQFAENSELKARGLELLRQKMLSTSVEFFQQFVREEAEDPEYQFEQGRAYRRLGQLLHVLGHSQQAEEALQQALTVFGRLAAADPQNVEYRRFLALSHNAVGAMYDQSGRTALAEREFEQARDGYAQVVKDHPDEPHHRAALAKCSQVLGLLYARTGRSDQAEQAFLQALAEQQRLTAAHPRTILYQQGLAGTHTELGHLYRRTGPADRAEPFYQKARAINQRLADAHPEDPGLLHSLANADNNLALVYTETGRPALAEQIYARARARLQRLVDTHPDVPVYQAHLAGCLTNLSILYFNTARIPQADEAGGRARDIFQRLAGANPKVIDYTINLYGCHLNQATLLRSLDQNEEALTWYDRAIPPLQAVLDKAPSLATARWVLLRLYAGRATVLGQLGRHTEADQALRQAVAVDGGQGDAEVSYARAFVLLYAGDHARATAAAEEAAAGKGLSSRGVYNLAVLYAQAIPLAQRDSRLTAAERTRLGAQYAAGAVGLLRKAQAAGFFMVPALVEKLQSHPDLAPLQSREDFQGLVRDLEEKVKGAAAGPVCGAGLQPAWVLASSKPALRFQPVGPIYNLFDPHHQ